MGKVTSKLRVTVPKAIAVQYGIQPGDEIGWVAAEDSIRLVPISRRQAPKLDVQSRLELFDQATARQQEWEATLGPSMRRKTKSHGRGWIREDLHFGS
jgi:bifunctional DNA-binding transcriptional regulator/antitoxin component of YhaV-PrlF toxin-antitoxin module